MWESWQKFWQLRANKICFLFLAALLLYVFWDAWQVENSPVVVPSMGQAVESESTALGGLRRAVQGTAVAGSLQDPFRMELSGKTDSGEKKGNSPPVSNEKDRWGTHCRIVEEPHTPPPEDVAPEPVLTGILQSEEKRLALLRLAGQNFSVPVGGRVGGYEVIFIGTGEVGLSGKTGEIVLEIDKTEP